MKIFTTGQNTSARKIAFLSNLRKIRNSTGGQRIFQHFRSLPKTRINFPSNETDSVKFRQKFEKLQQFENWQFFAYLTYFVHPLYFSSKNRVLRGVPTVCDSPFWLAEREKECDFDRGYLRFYKGWLVGWWIPPAGLGGRGGGGRRTGKGAATWPPRFGVTPYVVRVCDFVCGVSLRCTADEEHWPIGQFGVDLE